MIDPIHFTNYDLTDAGLQEYILFTIAVAGKPALPTAARLEKLLHPRYSLDGVQTPFDAILSYRSQENLRRKMRHLGFGCHRLKSRGFWTIALVNPDLRAAPRAWLEEFPGIGQKTSRYFLMHTRRHARCACLDTHVLRFLRDLGLPGIPKHTPGSRKLYQKIEAMFLGIADSQPLSIAEFDLKIWNAYRAGKEEELLQEVKGLICA